MKKVKRIPMVLSIVVTVILASLHPANSTLAETHTYDGKSPYYNHCADSAVTKDKVWIDSVSYVELKYSTSCKTAWAKVTLTRNATSNYEADARIVRSTDGKAYTCDSSGGNGAVNKGQTSCYTAMVYDYNPRKAQSQGKHAIATSDAYNQEETIWY
ncbi:DUF2690 domain-containing protein [Fictibacillus enclensis]|nr:DUF2690 domain-containing protein [Fictibacillus enclensis]WHY74833.1 DUF2690 domain-containing protein [Fictibacillus enclensis]